MREIVKGAVSAEVRIEISQGVRSVAVISTRAAKALGLAAGKPAYALIKASSVVIAVD